MTVKICLTISLILGLFFCSLMLPKRDSIFKTQIAVEALKVENDTVQTQAESLPKEQGIADVSRIYWEFLFTLITLVAASAILIIAFAKYDQLTRRLDGKEDSDPGSIR